MGLAIASAIAYGYSAMFVTSPSPENLLTFFEFVVKGLNDLEYQVCWLESIQVSFCLFK